MLRHQPDHFWAQCLSAICFLQLQRPLEAKASLNACLNQERDFAWLYLLRGFASGQVGSIFARADGVAAQPSNLLGKAEDHFVAAEEDYARALELLERKPVAELRYVLLVNRGLLRWQRRDLDRAVADLQEAIRLDARLYQAHAGLAQVLRQQGKPDEAVEQFTQAIALRPDLAPLYRGRAGVYQGRKDLTSDQSEAAVLDLDEAVRRESPANPVLALDHTNRAWLLERAGRHAEALTACDAALRAVPDYADAHRLRLGVLLTLQRYDDVIASCDAVLKTRPTAEAFEFRGLAKDRRKDFSGAIDDYTQALARRPTSRGSGTAAAGPTSSPMRPNWPWKTSSGRSSSTDRTATRIAAGARRESCWASIAPRSPTPRNRSATANRTLGCTISRAGSMRGPLRPRRARFARRVARPWR